jgi:hypothetical protein
MIPPITHLSQLTQKHRHVALYLAWRASRNEAVRPDECHPATRQALRRRGLVYDNEPHEPIRPTPLLLSLVNEFLRETISQDSISRVRKVADETWLPQTVYVEAAPGFPVATAAAGGQLSGYFGPYLTVLPTRYFTGYGTLEEF